MNRTELIRIAKRLYAICKLTSCFRETRQSGFRPGEKQKDGNMNDRGPRGVL